MNQHQSNVKRPTATRLWLAALAALMLVLGCASRDGTEHTAVEASEITLSTDVLGFESPTLWKASVPLSKSTDHSQGAFSLGVAAKGYVPITSVPLPAPIKLDSTISVDLKLPLTQANPQWFGTLQMILNSPSSNIYNAFVGQIELTGLPLGAFETLTLKVPTDVLSRIKTNASDFTITVVINVPANASGVYLLDNLSLATVVASCNASNAGASCDDANPCTSDDKCSSNVCKGTPISDCTFDRNSNTATVNWNRPGVVNAFYPNCTNPGNSTEYHHAVPFPIPPSVSLNSKAAATLALKISHAFHPDVTCTYSAGTSTSTATRSALLSSCSDGSPASTVIQATGFTLDVASAPGVASPGDGVCSHSAVSATVPVGNDDLPILPEPLSAAQTTALRSSFSWATTQPVAELDSQGRPLLYYALVYLENVRQGQFLDDLHIHHDFLPIFEGLARWKGTRGMFVHHGDGQGVYTYAVMIGSQFNFLRTAALSGTTIFNAVNLLNAPPAFANPDGKTLSYRALALSGFRYRGVDPRTVTPLAPILCGGSLGGAVVQKGAELYHDVDNAVSGFLGGLLGDVKGTVSVRLRFHILNTDPSFNDLSAVSPASVANNAILAWQPGIKRRRMQTAWGPAPGFPLTANGATVEVRGINFPSYRSATLENDSDASVEFTKGSETAVCILPKNGAVDVIDFLTTVQVCDFMIHRTEVSTAYDYDVATDAMNVFVTISDNANFSKVVYGFAPEQMVALVGQFADLMPNKAFTPCFNKNNLAGEFMTSVLHILATILETKEGDLPAALELLALGTCVYEVDMIVPSEDGVARSRAVTSHEYGHWMMCDLLGDPGISTAYNTAILETLLPQHENLGECNQACGNEAFADFWSAQVVGATTYVGFNDAVTDNTGWSDNGREQIAAWCPAASDQCFEDNVGGPLQATNPLQNPGDADDNTRRLNIGRVTSIYQDFVDGTESLGSHSFTNGNYWKKIPLVTTGLTQFDYAAQAGGTRHDELLSLPGQGISQSILNRRGISIDQDALLGGLADEAYAEGADWCDLCLLFANHNPQACTPVAGEPACTAAHCSSTPTCTPLESEVKLYSLCARSQNITKWIGPMPSTSDPNSCTFVPATSCPDGQIVSTAGTCIVPPCSGGLVLELDGTCQSSCAPQDVDGVMTPTPIGNGRCLYLVS